MGESEGVTVYDGDGSTTARVEDHKQRNGHSNRSQAARELIAAGERLVSSRGILTIVFAAVATLEGALGIGLISGGFGWLWQVAGVGIAVAGVLTAYFVYWINRIDSTE